MQVRPVPATDLFKTSDALILVRLQCSLMKINADKLPPTDPFFVESIVVNAKLASIENTIKDCEQTRTSIYAVEATLNTLVKNLEENKAVNAAMLKQTLSPRIETLRTLIQKTKDADSTLSLLDAEIKSWAKKRLAAIDTQFARILAAPTPRKMSDHIRQTTPSTKIEELAKSISKAIINVTNYANQINNAYISLRGMAPGTGPIKLPSLDNLAEQQKSTLTATTGR